MPTIMNRAGMPLNVQAMDMSIFKVAGEAD
jgi:hypothetical protein